MQRGSNGVAVAGGIAVHEQACKRDAEMMPTTKMGGQRADRAKARQLISKCLLALSAELCSSHKPQATSLPFFNSTACPFVPLKLRKRQYTMEIS
jgi:hypothetical protein